MLLRSIRESKTGLVTEVNSVQGRRKGVQADFSPFIFHKGLSPEIFLGLELKMYLSPRSTKNNTSSTPSPLVSGNNIFLDTRLSGSLV